MDSKFRSLAISESPFNIRVYLGKDWQGWKLFCTMLRKFVEKLDYARCYFDNISKIPSPNMRGKISYVEMTKSSLSNSLAPRSKTKEIGQIPSQNRKLQVPDHSPPPIKKQCLIKNHEAMKVKIEIYGLYQNYLS